MRPRHSILAVAAAALLVIPLAACSGGSGDSGGGARDEGASGRAVAEKDSAEEYSTAMTDSTGDAATTEEGAGPQAGKSIISTGDVSIVVSDTAGAAEQVADAVGDLGGSVESQEISGEASEPGAPGGGSSAYLVVRVPADRFDEAFDALAEIGEVTSQSRSATDVTAEHVDLQARVNALEKAVKRLSDLMGRAGSTSELLEVESALSQRQQELDGLTAQLKALEGQVAESTISVSLSTRSALPGGGPANFWEGLLAGFSSLGATGSGALVLAGILLPWLFVAAIVAVAVVFVVRAARRRRAARRPGPAAAQGGGTTPVDETAGAASPAPAPDPAPDLAPDLAESGSGSTP